MDSNKLLLLITDEIHNIRLVFSQQMSTLDICQHITIAISKLMFEFFSFLLKGNYSQSKSLTWFLKPNMTCPNSLTLKVMLAGY